jgi:hypothetical protein
VGTRNIIAHNTKFNLSAQMQIETQFRNNKLSYKVINQSGAGFIIGKIRGGLNEEVEQTAKLNPAKVAFTEENYTFKSAGEASFDLYQLFSKPLRKENLLIDGSIFLTPDGDLVRVEGRLVKNPSFWTKDVNLTKVYDRIMGFRLPVFLESIAQVRFVGESTLTINYHYLSVNGKTVTETN